ncbi:unnamed protein product, partial [Discosporangium mesarthrocarpum]
LIQSQQSRARRHLFLAERAAYRVPRVPGDGGGSSVVKTVGVVGAGTMGGGIAIAHLLAGYPVVIIDAKQQENLERGLGMIEKAVQSAVRRGKVPKEVAEKAGHMLTSGTSTTLVKDCDMVRAVFENMDLKRRIFEELDRVCKDGAILCTNTSTLDVDLIAQATKRPDKVMGMHFFSPAHIMPLVECVRGKDSSPVTIASVMATTKRLKKARRKDLSVGVLVGNCDGFVGNRMLKWYTDETQFLLEEGASPSQVDRAVRAFGMGMGPLEMSDVAGNDISYLIRWDR